MEKPIIHSLIDGKPLKLKYETYQASDGVTLSYQRIGKGKPLVVLHGLGSSSADWELQVPALSKHFDLIMPDFRGFGESTQAYYDMPVPKQSVQQFASDVSDLIDQLGIFSCPVLGYSMGGAVAFQMAADHFEIASSINPLHPSKMLILNSLPSFEMDTLTKKYLGGLRLLLNKVMNMKQLASFVSRKLFPNDPEMREGLVERYSLNDKVPYTAALNALLGWHVRTYLPTLKQETLFVAADNDYSAVSEKERYAALMPNAKVKVVKDSYHGTPYDQTEIFNKIVLDFFKD